MNALGVRLQDGELRLSEPRGEWPVAFQQEAARLRPFLPRGSELEHIGSTAVPGLIAKPVLDLAAMLPDPEALGLLEAVLPEFGYRFHFDGGESRGRIWRKEPAGLCTHILHLVEAGEPQWTRWLVLRDLLRQSGEARRQYTEAKLSAINRTSDRQEYTRLKTATIEHLLDEA